MKRRLLRIVLISGLIGLLGCGGGGQDLILFFYRLTNIITDLSGIDFFVDRELSSANVAYGSSTLYVETSTDENFIFYDIFEAGTSNIIDSVVVETADERSVHLFAVGLRSPGSMQPVARIAPVIVTRTTPTGSNARLVVMHGYVRESGTQTPPIDFVRSGRIQPEIEDLDFADSRTILLAAGTYDLEVRIAGLKSGVLITRAGVTFEGGKVYIVLLRGLEGASGPTAPEIFVFEEPIRD